MDWLDLLAVQGTLKSLFQHHSLKPSILQHPAFFMVQFSHPYMTTGKTIALTIQTFVSKVMSLLFNVLVPWKKIYGKSRQLIKNQRHYSTQKLTDGSNTIPYSFPSLCV